MKFRFLFLPVLLLLCGSAAFAVTVRDVAFDTKNAGRVTFSHRTHLAQKQMANNCRACHDAIFDLKKKKQYSMADMGKGKSCGACHEGKRAFALGECVRCHKVADVVYKIKATGPTRFSHKAHLISSSACSTCHPAIFAAGPNRHFTMADMKNGKSCGACHNGTQSFGVDRCVTCHPVKEITYKVKETGPTHFSHKTHIEAAECSACHPKLYATTQKNKRAGMAAMQKGKSCGACHNAKQAFAVKECSKCHPTRELQFEEKSTGNVPFSHTFHTGLYGCGDCHAKLFGTTRSKVKVTMQQMEAGKSCGGCHDGKAAFSVKDKCEACHKM